jgi:5-methylcytosine-specific restriction enzyme A
MENEKEQFSTNLDLPFEIGQRIHRPIELHDCYGGNRQSGISPCAEYPYVFLFIAPSGDEYGYRDGWISENEFVLSGEGQYGDMEMKRGNLAILNHVEDNRALHLFSKISSGFYEYLGRFAYRSHEIQQGEDAEGKTRKMIQFRLKKL